jgi:glycosyltransferase involved in cell wall biosynthesis
VGDQEALLFYNRYWATAGGGEVHAAKLALALARHFEVHLLVDHLADLPRLAERYDLDLSGLKRRVIHASNDVAAEALSAEFPVFVNATYLSNASSRATRGALLTYFPVPSFAGAPATHALFRCGLGFYQPRVAKGRRTVRAFTSPSQLLIPPLSTSQTVSFELVKAAGPTPLSWITVTSANESFTVEIGNQPKEVLVSLPANERPSIITLSGPVWRTPSPEGNGIQRIAAAIVCPPELVSPWDGYKSVVTYDSIVSNSTFTSRWIKQRWGITAATIPPPVRMYSRGIKEKIILAVGRFFEGGHSKKQLEMVNNFRSLSERMPGWRLVMVGGVNAADAGYFNRVKAATEGFPIDLLPNASSAVMADLFAKASIFWHLTGLDESIDDHPERHEHFGISPVEAMSAGAVPIAVGGAGPSEVITHRSSGFLIETLVQLSEYTLLLSTDEALREAMSEQAQKDSLKYDQPHFEERVDSMLVPKLMETLGA